METLTAVAGAIGALAAVVGLILKWYFTRATKTDQARDLRREATEASEKASVDIAEDQARNVDVHTSDLLDDLDGILRVRKSAPTNTSGR